MSRFQIGDKVRVVDVYTDYYGRVYYINYIDTMYHNVVNIETGATNRFFEDQLDFYFEIGDKVIYTDVYGISSVYYIKSFLDNENWYMQCNEYKNIALVYKDNSENYFSVPTCKLKPYKEKEEMNVTKKVKAHKRDIQLASGAVAMLESLNKACEAAGGGGGYTWEELQQLSVADLCCMLGTNGIRFVYKDEDIIHGVYSYI